MIIMLLIKIIKISLLINNEKIEYFSKDLRYKKFKQYLIILLGVLIYIS